MEVRELNTHLQDEAETWTAEFVELGGETHLLGAQVRLLRKVRFMFVWLRTHTYNSVVQTALQYSPFYLFRSSMWDPP